MRPQSAKQKGRRAVQELKEAILAAFPQLQPGDIEVKATATPGEDLWLSPAARQLLPYAIEVKNTERLQLWEAIAQAESHAEKSGMAPLVVFKRNRSELFVALRLVDFLNHGSA